MTVLLRSLRAERSNLATGKGGVDRVYCVYILTNQRTTVLYTGVTGDLGARVYQPRVERGFDLPDEPGRNLLR